jgi:uncharacterized membrane protein YhhN
MSNRPLVGSRRDLLSNAFASFPPLRLNLRPHCYHPAMVEVIPVAVVCGALAALLKGIRVGDRGLEVAAKTAASIAFVLIGAVAWQRGDPYATWIVAGLVLCAAGDVLLLWESTFDPGLLSFLLGHVAYVIAFQTTLPFSSWPWTLLAPGAAVGVAAAVWLWPYLGHRRRIAIGAYMFVITIMVWGALAVTSAGLLPWTVAVGAVLFYLSDLTVARHRFVHAAFVNRAVGLPLYYAGQVLIALSA